MKPRPIDFIGAAVLAIVLIVVKLRMPSNAFSRP